MCKLRLRERAPINPKYWIREREWSQTGVWRRSKRVIYSKTQQKAEDQRLYSEQVWSGKARTGDRSLCARYTCQHKSKQATSYIGATAKSERPGQNYDCDVLSAKCPTQSYAISSNAPPPPPVQPPGTRSRRRPMAFSRSISTGKTSFL
jgi:hypothetical protein